MTYMNKDRFERLRLSLRKLSEDMAKIQEQIGNIKVGVKKARKEG